MKKMFCKQLQHLLKISIGQLITFQATDLPGADRFTDYAYEFHLISVIFLNTILSLNFPPVIHRVMTVEVISLLLLQVL